MAKLLAPSPTWLKHSNTQSGPLAWGRGEEHQPCSATASTNLESLQLVTTAWPAHGAGGITPGSCVLFSAWRSSDKSMGICLVLPICFTQRKHKGSSLSCNSLSLNPVLKRYSTTSYTSLTKYEHFLSCLGIENLSSPSTSCFWLKTSSCLPQHHRGSKCCLVNDDSLSFFSASSSFFPNNL